MTKKAIIVGIKINNQKDFDYMMDELENLVYANNINVSERLVQNLDKIHAGHYLGSGKIEELKKIIAETDVDMVIFNDELSPYQIRNLEEFLDIEVIDRTQLILDIFYKRAKTKEAKLQVEIARLQYELPRMRTSRDEKLDQQSGASGTSNRGAGETKLEINYRTIKHRIQLLNKELENVIKERDIQRKQRKKNQISVVSLVGYTNAGKSTIMNKFVNKFNKGESKEVFEKDMLFATLETSVRNITLPDRKKFLLTDTVGFVSNLPHHLIKAFRSTLEEVREADLLIHVVDYSSIHYKNMMQTTDSTLAEVGVKDIPVIYVYNKADLTEKEIPADDGDSIYISAKNDIGLDLLLEKIYDKIFQDYEKAVFLIPYNKGEIVSHFNENASVLDIKHEENGTKITAECRKSDIEKYKNYIIND
ncbi:GTP-binding protein HflX [Sebaldella termitidis]|uniref:GTPase HflX n=1 Tax=Sebaldella termitidis (strain ATCC 33386 / NCTC 11300) TaxID=526218 RepID=D1AML8_SEBTE|nr:GTPase HflX [Sebaldella termitidis]ACZ09592.1 GTP-binding proten HflX [Sebaldella termitidis ATCC 33386]MBP7979669.1 GTPase HflX [Sebaldella sp.]SUI24922.1 GTP-binding protein HflX [Sebaldella termitidis]